MEKLYISDEAIEKYGYAHFRGFEHDDFKLVATWGEFIELEDGLLLNRDDDDYYYISANEDDCSFNDIESLSNKIELAYMAQFFNMKAICQKANISYETYRNMTKGSSFAEEKAKKLLCTMKEICEEIEIIDND